MSESNHDDHSKNRPVENLREGPLKAAIWRNESEKGAYHSVTLARTYKDKDGEMRDTNSFHAKDMLALSELARRSHHHAQDLDRAAFKEQRRDGQDNGPSRQPSQNRDR